MTEPTAYAGKPAPFSAMHRHATQNRAYRLVWSDTHQSYVPAPEFSCSRGKRCSLLIAASLAVTIGVSTSSWAQSAGTLPTGGQVVAGQAVISQSGTAMHIQQTSQRAAIDWSTFSIGQNASVNFHQPSASAIVLNRVVSQDPTHILGKLSADGQVFIVNPAGMLFGQGAQVNAAAVLASTRNIAVSDFMDGIYRFAGNGAGKVLNEGRLTVGDGGYVALIGAQVTNLGEIHAPSGDVRLAAGDRVSVKLDNGSMASLTIERGTIDALTKNGGLIRADGGRIYLTAEALDSLSKAVVNNSGIIEARTAQNRNGTIVLLADMDVGETQVSGRLDASAPQTGNGGFIETSAHKVKIADGTQVTTKAAKGNSGTWLIDPNDYTIASSGGDISGATLSSNLGNGNVIIQSSDGHTAGNGDIFVNDVVSWSSNKLTLSAERNILINRNLNGSGTASLALEYGQGAVAAGNTADYTIASSVKINLPSGNNFSTKLGSDGSLVTYTVVTNLGAAGSVTGTDLQGMNGNLSANYALGGDIDASSTQSWNGSAGFEPIGGSEASPYRGTFAGLGHTISGLRMLRPDRGMLGMFGRTDHAVLRDVGMLGGYVTGYHGWRIGSLVGSSYFSTISNSYSTAEVSGTQFGVAVGGLVGENVSGKIIDSYATGRITGVASSAGGLVGENTGTITGSHATGEVVNSPESNHTYRAGGLVGTNTGGTIINSYATGDVSGGINTGGLVGESDHGTIMSNHATGTIRTPDSVNFGGSAGGLVGSSSYDTISNSYSTSNVLARYTWAQDAYHNWLGAPDVGGLIGSASYSNISNSYATGHVTGTRSVGGLVGGANHGGSINNSYATGTVDGVIEVGGLVGYASLNSINNSYSAGLVNGGVQERTGGLIGSSEWASPPPAVNNSFWNIETSGRATSVGGTGLTTAQMMQKASYTGWDIDGQAGTGSIWRIYEGYTYPLLRIYLTALTVNAQSGSRQYDGTTNGLGITYTDPKLLGTPIVIASGKDVGTWSLTAGGLYSVQLGYDISYGSGATLTIMPRVADLNGSRIYNRSTAVDAGIFTIGNLVTGEDLTLSGIGSVANKNVGNGKSVSVGSLTLGNGTHGLASNYTLSGGTYTADITPATISAVTGITAANKVYDGTAAANLTTSSAAFTGLFTGDQLSVVSASGAFGDKNAGNGKTVNIAGIGLGGTDAGNYVLGNNTATTFANITPRVVNLSGSRIYDGSATVNAGILGLGNLIAGESLTLSGSGSVVSMNVGNGKTIAQGSLALGNGVNGLASNYTLTGGTHLANVTARVINLSGSRSYDGSTTVSAGILGLGNLVAGESLTLTGSGSVADKNVGNNKAITLGSLLLGNGTNGMASNYTLAGGTHQAAITSRVVNLSGSRTYDGGTTVNAGIFSLGNLVAGESLSLTGSGSMADKSAGNGKAISLDTLALGNGTNGLASNYTLTGGSHAVNIGKATISAVTGISANNKTYDGTTTTSLDSSAAAFTGKVSGDSLSVTTATGTFSDKNAGQNKIVNISGIALGGADVGNYTLASNTATATADIAQRMVNLSGSRIYDGGTTVNAGIFSLGNLVAGENLSLTGSGSMADKSAGNGKAISLDTLALGNGTNGLASNYTLAGGSHAVNIGKATISAVTGISANNKTYDGTTTASLDSSAAAFTGKVNGDSLSVTTASGTFSDKNAGQNKAVNISGIALGGADVGNYTLGSSTAVATADIAQRMINLSGSRTYDGGTAVNAGILSLGNLVAGENLSLTGSGSMADKSAGNAKAISLDTLALGNGTNGLASNYTLAGGSHAVNIGKATISAVTGISANNKTYDGTTTASLDSSTAAFTGKVNGDSLSVTTASGTFSDKNAGQNKAVNISGIALGGADVGNYTLGSSTAVATADIAQRMINLSGSRTYDGGTAVNAGILSLGNLVAGENLSLTGSGSMADKSAGNGKAISLDTLVLGNGTNGLASNYTLAGGSHAVNIGKATISAVTGISANNKTYDGTTMASLGSSAAAFTGKVSGDSLSVTTATGTFSDKNAGQNKTVNISGIALGGADVGNYTLGSSTAVATADISRRTINVNLIGAVRKTFDGNANALLSADNYAVGNVVVGESLKIARTQGSYDSAEVGRNKSVVVDLSAGDYSVGSGTSLANYLPVVGKLIGIIGEIAASSNPGYLGAVISAGQTPGSGAQPPSQLNTLKLAERPSSDRKKLDGSFTLLADSTDVPRVFVTVSNGGMRLPNDIAAGFIEREGQ